jgi:formylmethanofuran dehydrogenase subunit E-like metal-binding protein
MALSSGISSYQFIGLPGGCRDDAQNNEFDSKRRAAGAG